MALFGKKSDGSTDSGTGSGAPATATATKDAKAKGGLFGKGKKGADAAPAPAPAPATTDAGFDDFSDFGSAFGAPAPEVSRVPVVTTRARPKVLGGTAIGLNIGNSSIKVVELRASGGSVKVTGAANYHTPPDCLSNGVIISQAALSNAIRSAIQAAGIKSKAVTTAVTGTGSIVVRVVELPRMSDKELEETMKTDAEKFIPFAPEEVRLDFRALRELPAPPDSPNVDVLIAAAQREVLYQYGDVIKAARLTPRAIEVEPLAAARALAHAVEGSEVNYARVTAAINIGSTSTEISVMRGDILVFTRTLPSGGNALTQALVDYLGLSESEAERVKQEYGDALPSFQGQPGMAPASGAGFDAGFGDDWSNMDFDTPADTATTTTTTTTTPVVTLQKDAPEQHGQNQDDPKASNKDAFDFDFGDLSNDRPEPTAAATPAAPAPTAPDSFSFDFDGPDAAPETTTAVVAGAASEVVTPEDPHQTPGGVSSTVISFGDEPAVIHAAPEATPEAGASASTSTPPTASSPAPDAFNFSFDSALEPEPVVAPVTPTAPATPTATSISALDFAFDAGETPSTSQPSADPSVSLNKSEPITDPSMVHIEADDTSAWGLDDLSATPVAPEPGSVVSATPVAPSNADVDAFDLDTIFNAPTASGTDADLFATPATGTVVGAGTIVGAGAAGLAASPSAVDDPFDATTGQDDFGSGLGNDRASNVDAPTVYSILHPLLDELAGEIRRSLEYHASRYPEAVVQNIELIGGGAKLRNLDAFLTQSLGIPASVADPMRNMGAVPHNIRADSPIYAVAIGLALRELIA